MTSQFSEMTSSPDFFDVVSFFLSSFAIGPSFLSNHHWFWSYDNFFYNRLTRNSEIGNTLVWILPKIWRLGWVRDTKFGTNVFDEMLLNALKYQGYSIYHFWVITGKPTGSKITPIPPGLEVSSWILSIFLVTSCAWEKFMP